MTHATDRPPVPKSADEKTMLTAWLDRHRATVRHKCAGLAPGLVHTPVLPTSPLMTMGGLVAHLRWVEHYWFESVLQGRTDLSPITAEDIDAEFKVAGRPLEGLLAEYEEQCDRSRAVTARLELGAGARRSRPGEDPVTLRWVLNHLTQETSRHNGHMDIMRELLDGSTGR